MEPIRADGLRYHGCAPIISLPWHLGYIETVAYPADERHVFERARTFIPYFDRPRRDEGGDGDTGGDEADHRLSYRESARTLLFNCRWSVISVGTGVKVGRY